MTTASVPANVFAFINVHIDHVGKLELLLAVHRAPGSVTELATVARRLELPRTQVRAMAEELAAEGVLDVSGSRVAMGRLGADDRWAIAEVSRLYHREPDAVVGVLRSLGRPVS